MPGRGKRRLWRVTVPLTHKDVHGFLFAHGPKDARKLMLDRLGLPHTKGHLSALKVRPATEKEKAQRMVEAITNKEEA